MAKLMNTTIVTLSFLLLVVRWQIYAAPVDSEDMKDLAPVLPLVGDVWDLVPAESEAVTMEEGMDQTQSPPEGEGTDKGQKGKGKGKGQEMSNEKRGKGNGKGQGKENGRIQEGEQAGKPEKK